MTILNLPFDMVYEISKHLDIDNLLNLRSTCMTMRYFVSLRVILKVIFGNLQEKVYDIKINMDRGIDTNNAKHVTHGFMLFKLFMLAGLIEHKYYDYYATRSLIKGYNGITDAYIKDGYLFTEEQILGMKVKYVVTRNLIDNSCIKINDKICRHLLIGLYKDRSTFVSCAVLELLIERGYEFKQDLIDDIYEYGLRYESKTTLHQLMKLGHLPNPYLMQWFVVHVWVIRLVINQDHSKFFEALLHAGYIPNEEVLNIILSDSRETQVKKVINEYLVEEI